MARFKTENEFRQKLGERHLEPSARVWEALSANLNEAPKAPERKSAPWWKYASAAVVFIALSIPLWQTSEPEFLKPEITAMPAPETPVTKQLPTVDAAPFVKPQAHSPKAPARAEQQISPSLIAEASPKIPVVQPSDVALPLEIPVTAMPDDAIPLVAPKPVAATGAKVHPRTLLASVDPETKAPKTNWIREMESRYQSLRAAVAQRNIEEHQ